MIVESKKISFWPIIITLNRLQRICLPELNMEYQLSENSFNETVARVQWYIELWNSMHPLICQFKEIVPVNDY